jgi:hypothetical protein
MPEYVGLAIAIKIRGTDDRPGGRYGCNTFAFSSATSVPAGGRRSASRRDGSDHQQLVARPRSRTPGRPVVTGIVALAAASERPGPDGKFRLPVLIADVIRISVFLRCPLTRSTIDQITRTIF